MIVTTRAAVMLLDGWHESCKALRRPPACRCRVRWAPRPLMLRCNGHDAVWGACQAALNPASTSRSSSDLAANLPAMFLSASPIAANAVRSWH